MRHKSHFTICFVAGMMLLLSLVNSRVTENEAVAEDSSDVRREIQPFRSPQGYVCHFSDTPIQIDGQLNDAAWNNAPWTNFFVDIEGSAKPVPRFGTRARMLWDDKYFYIAAEMDEPHVWGTLKEHDSVIFQDNDFEVFIDPDGDNHEYYEFEMNALNTGWDLLLPRPYKDGGQAVNGWEIPGLKTAVSVDGTLNNPEDKDRGWSVEIAFPWKALGELAYKKSPPDDGDQWRVDFSRVEWQHEIVDGKYRKVPGTREDNWVWSPQGVINMHRPETWGIVQFSRKSSGPVEFREDPAGPTRHLLHQLYYAQQEYRSTHGRWGRTIEELGFTADFSGATPITIEVTGDLYQATAEIISPDGKPQFWHIRQDSRIWKK
jgi:hypothetical protein